MLYSVILYELIREVYVSVYALTVWLCIISVCAYSDIDAILYRCMYHSDMSVLHREASISVNSCTNMSDVYLCDYYILILVIYTKG
jgi:hypothetical protein